MSELAIGLFDVKDTADFASVKAAGFDIVHTYEPMQTLAVASAYLDAATTAGLQVSQNMARDRLAEGDAFWIDWVSTLAEYDALAYWYMPEEPIVRGHNHALMLRLYEIIQQYDPQQRPAVLYFGAMAGIDQWCDVADILVGGCYPEWHATPRVCMWYWMDILHGSCLDKEVIGAAQFFNNSAFGGPPAQPSVHDARFDAFAAIIAGAVGVKWFSHYRGWDLVELRAGIQNIATELRELSPVIFTVDAPPSVTVSVISGPETVPYYGGRVYDSIQYLAKTNQGKRYLLACNLADEPITIRFSGLPFWIHDVAVKFEDRTVSATGGVFEDLFNSYDVHVYQWETEMSAVTDLQAVEADLRQKAIELVAQADAIAQVILDLQVLDDQLDAAADVIDTV